MSLPEFDRFDIRSFDGTRLEVQTWGQGDLPVVIANGLGGTLLAWSPLLRALGDRCRFISWDYRGLYNSGSPAIPENLRLEHHVQDMIAVFDTAGIERAVIAGWSMGVQVCIQAAADFASRIQGVILVNGTYGRIFETAFENAISRHLLPQANKLAIAIAPVMPPAVSWVTGQKWFLPVIDKLGLVDERLDREVFLEIAKGFKDLDFATYHRIMGYLNEHDGEPALSRILSPLLFVAGDRDMMTPASVKHVVASRAPRAEVFVVPGGTHYSLLEYPDLVTGRVERFLDEHFWSQEAQAS